MAMNGLNDKDIKRFAKGLAAGERVRALAEEEANRKAYSKALDGLTAEFRDALVERNYIKLFDLEIVCQKHDKEFLNIDKEKTLKGILGIEELKKMFVESLDPARVKEKYSPSIEALNAHGTRVHDTIFETAIRSQSRILGGYIGHRSNNSEKSFYETRQDCLLAIKQEHQRNLDRAFGFDKTKEKPREKEQGLSR